MGHGHWGHGGWGRRGWWGPGWGGAGWGGDYWWAPWFTTWTVPSYDDSDGIDVCYRGNRCAGVKSIDDIRACFPETHDWPQGSPKWKQINPC
jgi:hypothetical protein